MNHSRKAFVRELKSGEKYTRLLVPGEQSVSLKSGVVTLGPGDSVGGHSTGSREEVLVILHGQARIAIGGRDALDARGDMLVYIPEHTEHNVTNDGPETLRYIFIVSPV